MKRAVLLTIGIFMVLLISGCVQTDRLGAEPVSGRVCFDALCVEAEIADTPAEWSRGLMFREALPENEGMLFVFGAEDRHAFWMKNTEIPLDIIWISRGLEVVHVEEAVPCESEPCALYVPDEPALYVLEVSQGFAKQHGIKAGDAVDVTIV